MREGYFDTEKDLETLADLINETDLTKIEIEKALKNHRLYEYMDFNSDTVTLERVRVIFKNGRLGRIETQW